MFGLGPSARIFTKMMAVVMKFLRTTFDIVIVAYIDNLLMQAKDKQTCEKYVKNGLNRNVTVQFLYDRLLNLGCKPPENLIRCLDCKDNQRGGGFGAVEEIEISPTAKKINKDDSCAQTKKDIDALLAKQRDKGAKLRLVPEIYLCQQHLMNETHAHEAMVHELIHAVDMCR